MHKSSCVLPNNNQSCDSLVVDGDEDLAVRISEDGACFWQESSRKIGIFGLERLACQIESVDLKYTLTLSICVDGSKAGRSRSCERWQDRHSVEQEFLYPGVGRLRSVIRSIVVLTGDAPRSKATRQIDDIFLPRFASTALLLLLVLVQQHDSHEALESVNHEKLGVFLV